MKYRKQILDNGLRLITVPMPAVMSTTVMILVGVGSRYESEEASGVTHFLEHMLFKGSKKRPTPEQVSKTLDGIGAVSNAGTGKESTSYYIKAQARHLPEMFDILADLLTQPQLLPQEIEREKGVILSEIAVYEDTPHQRVGDIFETLLFPNSSLGWDISGTPETVARISREDFLKLRERFYVPENMVAVVSGGIDERKVKGMTEKCLGNLKGNRQHLTRNRKKEMFLQEEPRVLVKEKKTDQAHLVLGVRGNPRGHKDRWVEEVLAVILGSGKSSRLWLEIREKLGLAYRLETEVAHYRDQGFLATYAGVHLDHLEQAIKEILSQMRDLRAGKRLTEGELKKAKEFIKGQLSLSLEDTRNVAAFFGSFELLENKILTPDQLASEIDKVTINDVVRVANQFFRPERLNLAIIGPYRDSERFKKLLRI